MADKEKFEALARMIAEEMKASPPKPKLKLVARDDLARQVPTAKLLDAVTRDAYFARIRDLSKMYWLQWLVRQETQHFKRGLEELDDDQLIQLADKMERARSCRVEGIGFDEVPGLMREGTVAV